MRKYVALKLCVVEYEAIDVNIVPERGGHNIYVNFKGPNDGAHISYHASGQHHMKIGRKYVTMNGGENAKMLRHTCPPNSVSERQSPEPVGWARPQIEALTVCARPADISFDVSDLRQDQIVGLVVSVIGAAEPPRETTDDGYRIIGRFRFSDTITVEIEAFLIEL